MKDASKHPLQEMFTELLNGVEYKKLGECCQIWDNKRKPITKGARVAGEYPYYGANGVQDYVADYIFDGKYVLVGEDGSVITPSGTPVVNWAEGKIWVNNHAHIISEKEGILLRYLFHYLQTINITPLIHGNIPKLTGGDFRALNIPVPPLPVQEEIVRILDNFTNLAAELQAELQARQQQYQYYRDTLLSFEGRTDVEWKKIKDVYKRIKGTPITATKMKEIANPAGAVRVFAGGKTVIDANEEDIPNANITKVPSVLVQSRGVIDVIYYEQPFTFKNEMWAYTTENKISVKYLYYVMKSNIQTFRDAASGMGALPQISLGTTEDFKIPIPPLSEQQRIVDILDRFDKLTTDITAGLPAEIEARRKQYEYYRDRLLRFKRM